MCDKETIKEQLPTYQHTHQISIPSKKKEKIYG